MPRACPTKDLTFPEIDLGGTTLNERERVKGVVSSCRQDYHADRKNVRSLPLADASGHRTDHARRCAPGVPPKLRTLRAKAFGWPRHRPDVWVAKPQDFICSIIAGSQRSILYCAHRRLATSVPPADLDCLYRSGHGGRHAKSMHYKTPDMSKTILGGTTLNEASAIEGRGASGCDSPFEE